MEKGRIIAVLVLVAAGGGLLAYGLLHNSIAVSPKSVSPPEVVVVPGEPDMVPVSIPAQPEVMSEPAVTQEVARGGVTRDASGEIKKTYEGTQAPQACPT